jgi:hypothetical protein
MEIDRVTAPRTEKNRDRETAAEPKKEPGKQAGASARESAWDEGKSDPCAPTDVETPLVLRSD